MDKELLYLEKWVLYVAACIYENADCPGLEDQDNPNDLRAALASAINKLSKEVC